MRTFASVAFICAAALAQSPAPKQVTWTGYFADAGCGSNRFNQPTLIPPNPECAKQCIEKGSAAIFLSEEAKAAYQVKDYSGVVENLGYHLEITGRVDEASKTISVGSVKRISEFQPASCARPRKKS